MVWFILYTTAAEYSDAVDGGDGVAGFQRAEMTLYDVSCNNSGHHMLCFLGVSRRSCQPEVPYWMWRSASSGARARPGWNGF